MDPEGGVLLRTYRDGQNALVRLRLGELERARILWGLRSRCAGPTVLWPVEPAGNAKDAEPSDELPVSDP